MRDVAIKVLDPDLGAALGGERFLMVKAAIAQVPRVPSYFCGLINASNSLKPRRARSGGR